MSYQQLTSHYLTISHLDNVLGLLHWDMATMMPKGSAKARSAEATTLKSISHGLKTKPNIADWIDAAKNESLGQWERANLREIEREYNQANALPTDLVKAMSDATSACEIAWLKARPDNDFHSLKPYLERVFELVREQAQVLSERSGLDHYDALLDLYEPGYRRVELDSLFSELESFLPDLVGEIIQRQDQLGPIVKPSGPFDIEVQKQIGRDLMDCLGFNFDHGRLDVSAHPFCGGSPDDVRITTRYTADDFMQSIMGVIHETGHALYERGLPDRFRGQPVGRARSMGIHESQSLLMEMQACRSPDFVSYLAPKLRAAFDGNGPGWSTDEMLRSYLEVQRGLIRVDADEATYPLHVILRYRLEKALLSGDLALKDLPTAWNDGMVELVGIRPETDTDGCMQDIHWHMGSVGYFPTYTLGALNAAQLFDQAVTEVPTIPGDIGRGDFRGLVEWVREKIHQKGSLLSPNDLMVSATGRPLDPSVFKRHLERRYLEQ
ncbi:MAG: carboxypeptidase M32 [Myxococcota bacterium]|nr:carboxypeptidase M32 [Myxococcota bacterium]